MNTETVLKMHEAKRTKCMVYTRVMGYHRPVESFNIGKKQEHKERLHFCERTLRYEHESAL
ncbi:MAG: anaerobic ribonucleoside-triphosphate reductase [Sulfuricurvum sp.]|nr:anaerobic ribonucleoside-triphosphate reductase [Sulfuricurvum sp.]